MTGYLLHRPRLEWIKGWHLFLLLILCEALLTWIYQSQILTREAYHALLKDQLEAQRIDALFELLQRMNLWGYAGIPLVIGIRILFVAFLLQLPLVLRFIDIPFRRLFRIVAVASLPLILLEGIRLLILAGIPAVQVTPADLTWIPLSLGALLDFSHTPASTQGFFSHFNLFEFGFLGLVFAGLRRGGGLKRLDAGLVVLLMWTVVILFQWAVMIYMERM